MRQLISIFLAVNLSATALHAGCFADYKAKRDDPLRLHYGVAEIAGPCTTSNAQAELIDKLAADGWTLLNILGVFDDAGLDDRKDSAGEYYLRY